MEPQNVESYAWPEEMRGQLQQAQEHAKALRRERIATAAMQGLLSAGDDSRLVPQDASLRGLAAYAVSFADAVIAELDRKPKTDG